MDEAGEWVEVVPALPAAEADAAWHAWLAKWDAPLDLGEVIVDTGRATYGTFKRYRVRRSALGT